MKVFKKVIFVRVFIVLSMLLVPLAGVSGVSAQTSTVIINEVDSDTPSYDVLEFIELFDGGVGNTALDGLVVVLFNGSDDASYLSFDLDGYTTNGGGYFVIGTVVGADLYVDPGSDGWLQNGADAVALIEGDGESFPEDTPVTTEGLIDAMVYDTNDSDDAGLLVLLNADQPQVNEDDGGDKNNHSNQRCPNGEGGVRNTDSYTQAISTPGAANDCTVPLLETTTALISSLNPADEGVEVTFTATVSPVVPGDVPTGDVTFKDGTDPLGVVTLDGAGQAAYTTSSLSVGLHSIYAEYSGDLVYAASSTSLVQQITGDVVIEAPDVNISEIRIDQTGSDNDEYFEIAGVPGTSLDGVTYLVIGDGPGGSGVIEATVDLTGQVIPASGYFVAAEITFTLGTPDLVTSLNFENSDNVTHLLVYDFVGMSGDDLDTDDDGTLDITPWSEIIDLIALVEEENPPSGTEFHYGPPSVGPDGGYVPGHVQLCEDGWWIGEFSPVGLRDSPGAANLCVPVEELCGADFTPIYDIQGSEFETPMLGVEVWTEGVVVGDFQSGDLLKGFFLQDPAGDGDAATSDGIFVYERYDDVSVGDHVRVYGTATEYNGLTEITWVDKVVICEAVTPVLPTVLSLPVTDQNDWEAFEGMLVTFPQTLYISEYYNFDYYGEIVLTGSRQFQPTAVFGPYSQEAAQLLQANLLDRITLDDGRTSTNPDPAIHPNGDIFNLGNLFRGGDELQNVTGVINEYYGYKIQPTQKPTYTSANPRPALSVDVGGSLKVAGFNVLNYFTTLNSRGADTPEEFTRQRDKIFAALSAMDADVVGLTEIENNGTALADLVDGLNAVVGAGKYAYVDTGVIGTDEIAVAFIYKPATVSLVGAFAVLDTENFTDPNSTGTAKNRPALTQTFIDKTTGGIFTVVVNHLKSKGSGCGDGDDDPMAGSCNLTRTLAAQVLLDWLATDPTGSGDADFLIIGDLNSYDKEDPIVTLLAGDYTDLADHYLGEYAYSYLFDGQLGYLDYALASSDLVDEVTGATIWHINADEPDLIDYDMSYKKDNQDKLYEDDAYRSSDHDPVVTGLDVCDEIAPEIEVSVTPEMLWAPNHKYVTVDATVIATDNFDPNPTVTLVSVTSNEPDNGKGDGNHKDDIVIIDGFTFDLRAERSGLASGRVYTITYEVADACGNTTLGTATVNVPKSSYINKKRGHW